MIKRELFSKLKKHLSKKEITFIVGPRQAGKTTLMLLLKDYLEENGEKTLFLNLDIEAERRFFVSQEKLLRKIRLEMGNRKGFVFLDEIQRKENAGLFLKGIYDMRLPYKFIVSGSGSIELKEKIHESLVGRKRIFKLNTLSFLEFLNFKTNYKYEKKLPEFFQIEKEKTQALLEEFLNFGGYPSVVLEQEQKEKRGIIEEIYQSYLEKDISSLLGVKKEEAFTNLVRLIARQIGRLVNFSELSSTLGISLPTVKNYLWYLEKTFILEKVSPFFTNMRKEITKSPIFYFSDLGLRNYATQDFGRVELAFDLGFIFQNFIFSLLQKKFSSLGAKINFWRTKDGAEVDFVISSGREIIPLEVKFKKLPKETISRSLKSFIDKYKIKKALVVSLDLKKKIHFEKTTVYFFPFYKLLFENFEKFLKSPSL